MVRKEYDVETAPEVCLSPEFLGQKDKHAEAQAASEPPQLQDTSDLVKTRFVFLVLGMLGIAILFSVRVNLSVAIVAMVNNTALRSLAVESLVSGGLQDEIDDDLEDICPGGETNASLEKAQDGEFEWSEERQGFILSGYFYGYAVGQLPGGILAERWGGKLVFGVGTFVSALLTIITPPIAWWNDEMFFALRVIEGLAGSVTFPAVQSMVSAWSPPEERSKFSMIFSGGYLGIVICMPLSGLLCSWEVAGGWPMVFYVFGAIGVLWYVPWLYYVYDTPAAHPRISKEERAYIEGCIGAATSGKRKLATPWRQLLRCRGLWACATMHIGIGWVFYILLTCLPTYMLNVLRYDIKENAMLSTIPYVTAGLFGVVCSPAFEFATSNGLVSRMSAFRILIGIAAVGPAVALVVISLIGCQHMWIVVLLSVTGLCLGAQYTGIFTNLLDLAPNFSGTMLGISNTFCNGAGILAPVAVGVLTNNKQTRTQWNIVFYMSAAISLASFAVYLLLCQSEEQPWNNPPEKNDVEDSPATWKRKKSSVAGGQLNAGFVPDERAV